MSIELPKTYANSSTNTIGCMITNAKQVGHPPDLDDVAPGDRDPVIDGHLNGIHRLLPSTSIDSSPASAVWPASASRPVRARNTSSRLGRRRPTSLTATPSPASLVRASASEAAP